MYIYTYIHRKRQKRKAVDMGEADKRGNRR